VLPLRRSANPHICILPFYSEHCYICWSSNKYKITSVLLLVQIRILSLVADLQFVNSPANSRRSADETTHFRPRSTLVQITQFLTQPEPTLRGLCQYLYRSTSFKSSLQISLAGLCQYSCGSAFLIYPHRTNLTYLLQIHPTFSTNLYLDPPRCANALTQIVHFYSCYYCSSFVCAIRVHS